jgi:hypothetical protein
LKSHCERDLGGSPLFNSEERERMERKDDSNSTDEIEVTPEMIEVGVGTLYEFPITDPDEFSMREAVKAVFLAMISLHTHGKSRSKI